MKEAGAMLAPCLVAALVWGCGGGGGKYAAPHDTVRAAQQALKAGDEAGWRACLTQDNQSKLAEIDKLLEDLAKEKPELADQVRKRKQEQLGKLTEWLQSATLSLGEPQIDGDQASLDVTVDGKTKRVKLAKEADGWKLQLPISAEHVAMLRQWVELLKKAPDGVAGGLQKLGEELLKKK